MFLPLTIAGFWEIGEVSKTRFLLVFEDIVYKYLTNIANVTLFTYATNAMY